MENFFILVKDNDAFSVVNYLPDLPNDVNAYPASENDYKNFGNPNYIFDSESKKIISKSKEDLIETAWNELREKIGRAHV